MLEAVLAADRRLATWIHGDTAKRPIRRGIMKALEYSGHGIPWIAFALYLVLQPTAPTVGSVALMVAILLDLVVVGTLKTLVRRTRPSHNTEDMFATVHADRFSFPSGHTTRAVMLAVLFVSEPYLWLEKAPHLAYYMILWAASVSVSRVILGRHYPLDVLGGAIVGAAQALVVVHALQQPDILTGVNESLEVVRNATFPYLYSNN